MQIIFILFTPRSYNDLFTHRILLTTNHSLPDDGIMMVSCHDGTDILIKLTKFHASVKSDYLLYRKKINIGILSFAIMLMTNNIAFYYIFSIDW